MKIPDDLLIIGLTGSFGSGCSTIRRIFSKPPFAFIGIRIAEEVYKEAARRGIDLQAMEPSEKRRILQDIGNDLRKSHKNEYLAEKAIDKLETLLSNVESDNPVVIADGFRHTAEIKEFRKFPNFFLVAIDCDDEMERFRRLNPTYGDDLARFRRDDRRDRDEGLSYGQQVLRCVEQADIIFDNSARLETEQVGAESLAKEFGLKVELLKGEILIEPNYHETMIAVASSLALQSGCIQRQVGAVLCDKGGRIIAAAYNNVAGQNQKPCIVKYKKCNRKRFREEKEAKYLKKLKYCPICTTLLKKENNTLLCPSCGDARKDLPAYKLLDKCRSIHAEEAVLLSVDGPKAAGSTLYTTTMPCMQCAKRIVYAGVKQVYYIDPYPEDEPKDILLEGGVLLNKFFGVKAQVFQRIYASRRESLERELEE